MMTTSCDPGAARAAGRRGAGTGRGRGARAGAVVHGLRAVLPARVAQLGVPAQLQRGRADVLRVRLRPRHPVRDALPHPTRPRRCWRRRIYDHLTRRVLVRPPRLPLEEAAIEVEYAKLAPEAKVMFDWAHILHRQTYDVWADERIPLEEKDAPHGGDPGVLPEPPDLAFSTRPKSMELMDGQYYSLAFRERFPKFNGLIWAYHWLQVGLYEPLLVGRNPGRAAGAGRGPSPASGRCWRPARDHAVPDADDRRGRPPSPSATRRSPSSSTTCT
jgi:hypothetical protein